MRRIVVLIPLVLVVGASLSEPHTSKSNGGIFIYILYIYLSYIVP